MRKNVWIMNHYATEMFYNQGGRHYWFAENLLKQGYAPTVFCANTFHFKNGIIDLGNAKFRVDTVNSIPFIFVKTTPYKGNGTSRIKNMAGFAKNLFAVTKICAKTHGKPDVILASSVHPLTLVAGILIAKKFKVPCICEMRDLWPEVLVEYGAIKRNSLLAKLLYRGEKWIYKKADALIFSWAGGYDYICEKGWNNAIKATKVFYINNGVDIDKFDENAINYITDDIDLGNSELFKVVYTGAIRRVNSLGIIVDTARALHNYADIKFLIWGNGDELENLQTLVKKNNLNNIVFKGHVPKQQIPYIVSNSDLNIVHWQMTPLLRFGSSYNKLFEYMAAGKPVFSTVKTGYSIIEEKNCGKEAVEFSPNSLAEAIKSFYEMPKEQLVEMGINARQAVYEYDFAVLTNKLIDIIESKV